MIRRLVYTAALIIATITVMLILGAARLSPEETNQTPEPDATPSSPLPVPPPTETETAQAPVITFPELEREAGVPLIVVDPQYGLTGSGNPELDEMAEHINRTLAVKLEQKLTEKGCQVLLIQKEEFLTVPDSGIRTANHYQADLYISIRQVIDPLSEMNGVQTWYDGKDQSGNSQKLAELIQQAIIRNTGIWDRDLKSDAAFSTEETLQIPACIIETGNITKLKDREILTGDIFQEQLAAAVAEGINSHFNPKLIYLTFDDGPSTKYTNEVLDILKEKNIKATFFVVGENVLKNPETTRRITAEGHAIGVHCNSHVYNTVYQSTDSYIEDFETARQIIYDTTGVETWLYRYPGGSVSVSSREHLSGLFAEMNSRGYIYYDWNVSLEDTVNNTAPEQMIANARNGIKGKDRAIVLAHDIVPKTVASLDELLDELISQYPEHRMEILTPEVPPIQFRQ